MKTWQWTNKEQMSEQTSSSCHILSTDSRSNLKNNDIDSENSGEGATILE